MRDFYTLTAFLLMALAGIWRICWTDAQRFHEADVQHQMDVAHYHRAEMERDYEKARANDAEERAETCSNYVKERNAKEHREHVERVILGGFPVPHGWTIKDFVIDGKAHTITGNCKNGGGGDGTTKR